MRDEALTDRRHLELHLDQFRIEQPHEHVVSPLAVDHREFESFVVQPLLDAGFGRHRGDLVVFVGRSLHVIHRRAVSRAETGRDHLRHADVFRPRDALVLSFAKLLHAAMSALTFETVIAQNLLDLLAVRQAREVVVSKRRAQFDSFDADVFQRLQ